MFSTGRVTGSTSSLRRARRDALGGADGELGRIRVGQGPALEPGWRQLGCPQFRCQDRQQPVPESSEGAKWEVAGVVPEPALGTETPERTRAVTGCQCHARNPAEAVADELDMPDVTEHLQRLPEQRCRAFMASRLGGHKAKMDRSQGNADIAALAVPNCSGLLEPPFRLTKVTPVERHQPEIERHHRKVLATPGALLGELLRRALRLPQEVDRGVVISARERGEPHRLPGPAFEPPRRFRTGRGVDDVERREDMPCHVPQVVRAIVITLR